VLSCIIDDRLVFKTAYKLFKVDIYLWKNCERGFMVYLLCRDGSANSNYTTSKGEIKENDC